MTRFENLEFESNHKPRSNAGNKPASGETVRGARWFHDKALRSYLTGSFENALREYSRSLENDPAFIKSWFGQIRMLIELKEFVEAGMWSDKALESFPENAEIFALKALAACRDGKQSKALSFSDLSISKNEPSSFVWIVRAEVIGRKRNVSQSCASKAVSAAQGEDQALVMLEAGRALLAGKNYTDALKYLKKAVALIPDSALAWYELGCCQVELGFDDAADSLEQALMLHPHWKQAQDMYYRASDTGFIRRILLRIFRR